MFSRTHYPLSGNRAETLLAAAGIRLFTRLLTQLTAIVVASLAFSPVFAAPPLSFPMEADDPEVLVYLRAHVTSQPQPHIVSDDDNIAMAACWSMIVNEMSTDHFLKSDTSHFIGFVEGRLRLVIPEWWKQTLAAGRFQGERGEPYFVVDELPERWLKTGSWSLSGCEHVAKKGKELEILSQKRWYTIRQRHLSLFDEGDDEEWFTDFPKDDPNGITFHATNQYIFFGITEGTVHSPKMIDWFHCLDASTSKGLWSEPVLSGQTYLNSTGSRRDGNFSEITSDESRVFLFSANEYALSFSGFNAADGRPLARFSTTYCSRKGR